jgi:hypothetical protein
MQSNGAGKKPKGRTWKTERRNMAKFSTVTPVFVNRLIVRAIIMIQFEIAEEERVIETGAVCLL